jgi:hypothetical protein
MFFQKKVKTESSMAKISKVQGLESKGSKTNEAQGSGSEKSKAMKISESRLRWQSFAWILVGLVLVLLDANMELSQSPVGNKVDFAPLFNRLLEAAGIASIIFGIFSIFIELPGLRRYFLERMKELVIDQAYLDTLDKNELLELQNNALKAHFKNTDISREGRFLGFLNDHIYAYINDPYRERVTLEIRYEEGGEGLFVAKDRLSYICRKSKDSIISAIVWHNDPGEIEDVKSLKITVRYPQDRGELGEPITIGELTGEEIIIFNGNGKEEKVEVGKEIKNLLRRESKHSLVEGDGLRIKIGESYRNIDFMKVTVDAVYVVKSSHLLYWSMNYPTRDFSLTLRFPDSYIAQAAAFINSEHVGQLADEKGYYSFNYNSWMIPQSGVAWRLIPAKDQGVSQHNLPSEHQPR